MVLDAANARLEMMWSETVKTVIVIETVTLTVTIIAWSYPANPAIVKPRPLLISPSWSFNQLCASLNWSCMRHGKASSISVSSS